MLARELERVAVGRDDECLAAALLLLARRGCEEVVGFVAGSLRRGEAECANELREQVELLQEVVVEHTTRLVRVEQLMPVRRRIERIPADEHCTRSLRVPEPHDEVGEAEQRVSRPPFCAPKALGQRVVRTMRK